jgi:hypothetical protein
MDWDNLDGETKNAYIILAWLSVGKRLFGRSRGWEVGTRMDLGKIVFEKGRRLSIMPNGGL